MAIEQKQQAIFPDIPRTAKAIDSEGNWNTEWKLFFDQLILALQTNLKPEGFVLPPQSASNIGNLTGEQSYNNILFNTDINLPQCYVQTSPGVFAWKTFTLF